MPRKSDESAFLERVLASAPRPGITGDILVRMAQALARTPTPAAMRPGGGSFGGGGASGTWGPKFTPPKKRRKQRVLPPLLRSRPQPYYHSPCGTFTPGQGWGEPSNGWEDYWEAICTIAEDGNNRYPTNAWITNGIQGQCMDFVNNFGCGNPMSATVPAYEQQVVTIHAEQPSHLPPGFCFFSSNATYRRIQAGDAPAPGIGGPCSTPVSVAQDLDPASHDKHDKEPNPNQERKRNPDRPSDEPPPEEDQPRRSRYPLPSMVEWLIGPPVVVPPFGGITPRQPPRGRQKEKKARSGIFLLLRVLDRISESAEVVDALFDALPCKIKKQALNKCRNKSPIDNFGQYGIDRAECKAKALWDHWDQLDVEVGLANIVRNEIEDQLYGKMYQNLPRNIGSAANPVDAYNRANQRDGNFDNDQRIDPVSDLISETVDQISKTLGLPEPIKC